MLALAAVVALANQSNRADIIFGIVSGKIHSNPFAPVRLFALNGIEQIWILVRLSCCYIWEVSSLQSLMIYLIALFICVCGFCTGSVSYLDTSRNNWEFCLHLRNRDQAFHRVIRQSVN